MATSPEGVAVWLSTMASCIPMPIISGLKSFIVDNNIDGTAFSAILDECRLDDLWVDDLTPLHMTRMRKAWHADFPSPSYRPGPSLRNSMPAGQWSSSLNSPNSPARQQPASPAAAPVASPAGAPVASRQEEMPQSGYCGSPFATGPGATIPTALFAAAVGRLAHWAGFDLASAIEELRAVMAAQVCDELALVLLQRPGGNFLPSGHKRFDAPPQHAAAWSDRPATQQPSRPQAWTDGPAVQSQPQSRSQMWSDGPSAPSQPQQQSRSQAWTDGPGTPSQPQSRPQAWTNGPSVPSQPRYAPEAPRYDRGPSTPPAEPSRGSRQEAAPEEWSPRGCGNFGSSSPSQAAPPGSRGRGRGSCAPDAGGGGPSRSFGGRGSGGRDDGPGGQDNDCRTASAVSTWVRELPNSQLPSRERDALAAAVEAEGLNGSRFTAAIADSAGMASRGVPSPVQLLKIRKAWEQALREDACRLIASEARSQKPAAKAVKMIF
mmetsp:Transcript_6910/g.14958  ORF Transcript_6910/g.14958 Transcript_6910/m.14958 type:complete len:490 (-) Transcript_6910:69-1538(-)